MNEPQNTVIVSRSLKIKFSFMIALLTLLIVAGNWVSFQQSKSVILKELETRGTWIARNLAYDTWYGVFTQNKGWLEELAEGVINEEDIIYVAIANNTGDILISKYQTEEEEERPLVEGPKHVCETPEPTIYSQFLLNHQTYMVEVPVLKQEMSWQLSNTGGFSLQNRGGSNASPTEQVDFSSACLGVIQLGISLSNIDYKLTRILLTFVLLSVLVIAIGIIGYTVASRVLVSPILEMADVAIRISEGDLRPTIPITSQDEVGVLETALSRIITAFRQIAERLQNASDQMMTASDEILQMSEDLSSVSQRQSAAIYHISKNIETNAVSSQAIAENSDSVATIAEATLEATLAVQDTVYSAITSIQEIQEQTGKNGNRVLHLGEKVAQIGKVVKMINTIADQTRLIAFNASIEAAGAGETGGRFSIVATEVRRLANTVVEALEEIRELVSSIQSATNELSLSSETGIRKAKQGASLITETGKTLHQIMEMIENTTQSAKEISISTQQQQEEYDKIVQEIKEIVDGSEQSVDMSRRTTIIAKELRKLANELDSVVQHFNINNPE